MEAKPKKEEEIYSLRYLQQLYQNQYTSITTEMNRSLEYMGQLSEAQKTIENTGAIKGKDTLVDLGAGIFMNANVKKLDNVMVSIGAGYVAEKSIEDTKQFVAARIEKVNTLFNRLVKNRNELRNAIMEVNYRLDALNR